MSACPACRARVPDGARFCPACGTRLEAAGPESTERKVVTTLFADLVGFTALGERHDPEDIDAALRGFYALARRIIERFGGTVEKFIGDAVVGLFGVPLAHEDDAERAVRAALELVARMSELQPVGGESLQVRCAVNTGSALVRLLPRPEAGEGVLVGDTVNICARLMAGTPSMTVAVGSATYRLTSHAIEYERLLPLSAKGKTRSLSRWRPCRPVARCGSALGMQDAGPIVGREVELAILSGLLDRAIASGSPQYALVTGEAGVGKSRLLRQFFRLVDERTAVLCNWRQAGCPAYGSDLAYWAIRDIACSHLGIVPGEDQHLVEHKLVQAVSGEPDDWLATHLRPLVGLPGPKAERHEAFAAWTHFFESIAGSRPAVVVVEDLHWASAPTLEFLEHLVAHATGIPLLMVCTARPEFLDGRADVFDLTPWTPLDIKPLDDAETARLVHGLRSENDTAELDALVAERCGGNPLFAEELVRYYAEIASPSRDRGDSEVRHDAPNSLLTLIAARLDALLPERKSILADASIFGPVFLAEGVAALEGLEADEVMAGLDQLEARGFVRRQGDSSIEGEIEFRFWHALVRDVAYEGLARPSRAVRHLRAARWLAERSRGSDDSLEVVAHHFATGLDLARACGDSKLAEDNRAAARETFIKAGDRALRLDVDAARRHYERALDESGAGDDSRPALLLKLGAALRAVDQDEQAAARLQEAAELYEAHENARGQAHAMSQLAFTLAEEYPAEGRSWLDRAVHLLDAAASPEAVAVLETLATLRLWDGDLPAVLDTTRRILAMQEELGQPPSPRAQGLHGYTRCMLGEPEGLREQELAMAASEAAGVAPELFGIRNAYARWVCILEGPAAALALSRRWMAEAERRRDLSSAVELGMYACRELLLCAQWRDALSAADGLKREGRSVTQPVSETEVCAARICAYLGLGIARDAKPYAERYLRLVAGLEPPLTFGAITTAALEYRTGNRDRAADLLEPLVETTRFVLEPIDVLWWPLAVRTALVAGGAELAEPLARVALDWPACPPRVSLALEALLLEARGQAEQAAVAYRDAAAAWKIGGSPHEEGIALLGLGRCLRAQGSEKEARSALAQARTVLTRIGARTELEEADRALDAEQTSGAVRPQDPDSRIPSSYGTPAGGQQ